MKQSDFMMFMFESMANISAKKMPDGSLCEDENKLLDAWKSTFSKQESFLADSCEEAIT